MLAIINCSAGCFAKPALSDIGTRVTHPERDVLLVLAASACFCLGIGFFWVRKIQIGSGSLFGAMVAIPSVLMACSVNWLRGDEGVKADGGEFLLILLNPIIICILVLAGAAIGCLPRVLWTAVRASLHTNTSVKHGAMWR